MTFKPVEVLRVPGDFCACRIVLVRHTEVDQSVKGICYGRSDVGLSAKGDDDLGKLALQLRAVEPDRVMHSGLSRASQLAELVAEQCEMTADSDTRLQEMDFGEWEMRPWAEIYQDSPTDMDRILSEPDSFAPGGGETLFQVRDRVVSWMRDLPDVKNVVAVTHGGPISILRGVFRALPVNDWPNLVPGYGEGIVIEPAMAVG